MKDILDLHTHTLASGHAFSTIREMAAAAKNKGLELLAITEHAPSMPGTCHEFYFESIRCLDRTDYAVPILFGVELNILNSDGDLDLHKELISSLDIAIASLHPPCIPFMNKAETTKTIINVMKRHDIHIIGHLDDARFPIDYDMIAHVAKETNTLLEVNNSSLTPYSFRLNAKENYLRLLESCEKYQTEIVLNSDAHVDTCVGNHDLAWAVLQEYNFPEHLVINNSVEKLTNKL